MKTFTTPATACPNCGALLDQTTSVGHSKQPKPGDWTVCAYCVEVLEITPAATLRLVAAAEIAAQPDDVRGVLALSRTAVVRARFDHPAPPKGGAS